MQESRGLSRPVRRLFNSPRQLMAAILAVWVGCSMLYALLEGKGPIEGLWWGIVTGSTVGYGDYYPASTAGRGIAVVLICSMLVLVPIAIGHVIAGFVVDRDQFSHDEQVALASALESAHERIDRIEHLLLAGLTEQHGADWVRRHLDDHARRDEESVDTAERMLGLLSHQDEPA